jgi:putative transposase
MVYHSFGCWRTDGTWKRSNNVLRGDLCVLAGRHRHLSAGLIDPQSVTTTERGGAHSFDSTNQGNGHTRRILVDMLGWLLAVVVTAAHVQDRDGAKQLLGVLRHGFPQLRCH